MILHSRLLLVASWLAISTLDAQTPQFRLPLQSNPGITAWFDHDPRSPNVLRYDGSTNFPYDEHHGTDFGAGRNTPVLAGASGVVVYGPLGLVTNCPDDQLHLTCGGSYGNHVRLRHADGKVSIYAHLLTLTSGLTANTNVSCGIEIGRSGRSGNTNGVTGYHLHFELWSDVNISQRLDFFSGPYNTTGYWVSQNGTSPDTQCQATGSTLPVITSFDITPHSAPAGSQLVATVKGDAGSKPLSTAGLMRTTDLTGSSGWTTVATQAVSGSSVNVSLNDTPPAGTFLYGAHLVDNTGGFGVEPAKVQVAIAQSSPEITSLTAIPQQASWVYYQSNSTAQWYISNSSGTTYLLSGAGGDSGELVWGGIANGSPVATVNYGAKTVYVGPSASSQTSATSYPGVTIAAARNLIVSSPRGYNAAQQISGQTMSHAWYFFQVQATQTWYIVNVTGTDTIVFRLRLKPDNSDYDWFQISNSSWKRSFSPATSSMTITLSER
jgi:murein DD-endopeptidase MepM/ murein hydrolase activator NlpD